MVSCLLERNPLSRCVCAHRLQQLAKAALNDKTYIIYWFLSIYQPILRFRCNLLMVRYNTRFVWNYAHLCITIEINADVVGVFRVMN